jgi:hypothetical protein
MMTQAQLDLDTCTGASARGGWRGFYFFLIRVA